MKAQFDAVGINICIFKCSEKYEIKTCCRLLDEAGKKYVIQYIESKIMNSRFETVNSNMTEISLEDFNRITELGLRISSSELFSEMDLNNCIILDDGHYIKISISIGMAFTAVYYLAWPYTGLSEQDQGAHNQILHLIEEICAIAGIEQNVILND